MAKLRKMLGRADSPWIMSLMRLIDTQSHATVSAWCVSYARQYMLSIYERAFPGDNRPRLALEAAQGYLDGRVKLSEAKKVIRDAQTAAAQAAAQPAAQAAARAAFVSAASIHTPSHALALAFYGAAALAYDQAGLEQTDAFYDDFAARAVGQMNKSLASVSVENEPNPVKIHWNC